MPYKNKIKEHLCEVPTLKKLVLVQIKRRVALNVETFSFFNIRKYSGRTQSYSPHPHIEFSPCIFFAHKISWSITAGYVE